MRGFEIYIDSYGKYRFRLKDEQGRTLLSSVSFKTIKKCQEGISQLKRNADLEVNYERKRIHGGYSFNVCVSGEDLIASGELCGSEDRREQMIESVKGLACNSMTLASLN